MHLSGYGRQQCYKTAIEYLQKARCQPENREDCNTACLVLGKMSLFGDGKRVNYAQAYEMFKEASDNGSQDGLYWRGYMHEYRLAPESNGLNFNQAINKAEQYYKLAGDHTDALTDRAFFYENK